MSSGPQGKRAQLLGQLAQEFRQFNALGASFFRAAAARAGMAVTDLQVVDILDSTGPTTAGQLAELTGLTTGAIAQMLNRLEETGMVRRERDPVDGRRVIVRLTSGEDALRKIGPIFDSVGRESEQLASDYDDDQLAFVLEFLKRSNALSREEISRLREAPESEGDLFSAPLEDVTSGRLVFSTGITRLSVRGDDTITSLYRARFEGPVPDVKVKEGAITIRYPRLLGVVDWRQRVAEVSLNTAIPWQIVLQGGASEIIAELGKLNLAGLDVKGGMSMIRLDLPAPSRVVPIRISGGASEVVVRRPAGVAARVHLKGWVSTFVFDDQSFSNLGNDVWLQSRGYEGTGPCYDIEVSSSASMVTITTD